MDPIQKDCSVEITGANTAVLGGDYPFTVVVRSSGTPSGILSVYADNQLIYQNPLTPTPNLRISHTFLSTGTHVLKAVIEPDFDYHKENNEYQKAVYVVPKPEVLLVTSAESPLQTVLSQLYNIEVIEEMPRAQDLEKYKAVILDDRKYTEDLDSLVRYVRDGGGLVVVGGMNAYNLGGYYNSTLEQILPVRSFSSSFQGGKTTVVVLDISGSMQQQKMADGTAFLDYEKALALELLRSPLFRDDLVGVVVFGTKAYVVSPPMPLSRSFGSLEEKIASLWPSGTEETHLDDGLTLAWDMLNSSAEKGELILFSDGRLTDEVYGGSEQLIRNINATTYMIQIQAFANAPARLRSLALATDSQYYSAVYPSSLTIRSGEVQEEAAEERPLAKPKGYTLSIQKTDHYITSGIALNATITGFNDVTPRPGAQKLVAMADGKPVVSSWRYGLGRVVCLSSDNGNRWASALYSPESSMIISSMVNWAIGDPRPEGERVDAVDAWEGTALQITITSSAPPRIESQQRILVEKVGDRKFQATLDPGRPGIYYIGDYGIAVNYPLELRDVGFNPELEKLVMSSGGKVFTVEEALQSLVTEARRSSQRTVQDRVSRRDVLLITALGVFLCEVLLRRLKEFRRKITI
jgi:uncharacterized membrane protein